LSNPENNTFVKLENAVKERKVHRNAADFDGKFIHETMHAEVDEARQRLAGPVDEDAVRSARLRHWLQSP